MKRKAETVTTIDLGYEQMFLFDGGAESRVRVLHGATWLTEEGQSDDAFVRAGDEVVLHGGRALIEGLQPSRVQIVAGLPGGIARRAGRSLRAIAHRIRQRIERQQLGVSAAIEPNG